MGNMTVINANYDVKTAIARDMKNSLTRVSNDLVCEIWFHALTKAILKCQFWNFKPKSKWKKLEITLEKGFIFAPLKFFSTILDKKQEIFEQKVEIFHWNLTLRVPSGQFDVNFNPITVSGQSSHTGNGYQQRWT